MSIRLTNAGIALLAKMISGTEVIFTRGAFGDAEREGVMIEPSLTEQSELLALINERMSLPIVGLTAEATQAIVECEVENSGVEEDFRIAEIGLYAKETGGEEILYCYEFAGEHGDWMPKKQGSIVKDYVYRLYTTISNAALVTAIIQKNFTLPVATTESLGGIIVGNGLSIDGGGKLDVTLTGGTTYTLPVATAESLGGVKVGSGLSIDGAGKLDVTLQSESYTLPTATSQTKGGVKVGEGLKMTGESLTAAVNPFSEKVTMNGGFEIADSLSNRARFNTFDLRGSSVEGNIYFNDDVRFYDDARFYKNVYVSENADVSGKSLLRGEVKIYDDITVADSLTADLGSHGSIKAAADTINVNHSTINASAASLSAQSLTAGLGAASIDASAANIELGYATVNGSLANINLGMASVGGMGTFLNFNASNFNIGNNSDVHFSNGAGISGSVKAQAASIDAADSYVTLQAASLSAQSLSADLRYSSINAADSKVTLSGANISAGNATLSGKIALKNATLDGNPSNGDDNNKFFFGNTYITFHASSIDAWNASITGTPYFTNGLCLSTNPSSKEGAIWYTT